jgi:GWxTD domain-containing protein
MVEIYYSFNRDSIAHIPDGNQFVATYHTKLEILVKDSVLKTIEWNSQDMLNALTELKPNQMINDVYGLLLGQGEFKIKMEIKDLPGEKRAFNQIDLKIDQPQSDSLWISDIQVALQINRSEERNRFIKNGLSITPNPSNIFSLTWPVLYYYCEIYNLNLSDADDEIKYNVIASIKDIKGNIIKKIPAKSKSTTNNSVVELNKTLVSSLKSGAYNLSIEIVNLDNDEKVSQYKQFYVYRPADYVKSESDQSEIKDNLYLIFLTMTEEELDKEFEYVTYLSGSDEEDIYDELNLDGKRKFLAGFWGLKNTIIDMPTQVFRANYLERVMLATERYSYSGQEGWRTARGRIMLVYGLPDNINKQYGGPDTKQYETWIYNGLEGGSIFIFLDISGYGNFQLVHSTVSTEINDPNWEGNYLR